ncbi:MAG: hypothetical protein A2Z25_06490 [Planctomycetes bacterium RBG_16_55_9]|nr:MAG: hypothetical protein A2Z25_06490 [Planctomycetes bacterium RBG_16_55_9]
MILTVVVATALSGCGPMSEGGRPARKEREFLTVDFQAGRSLRYKFVSSREIMIDLEGQSAAVTGRSVTDKSSELMEIVVSYTPVEVDPYGLTKVKATCESVRITRNKGPNRDAVKSLSGKTFTLTVGPTGRIEDYSELDELTREIGQKAFRTDSDGSRIKESDMIGDFVATQWFLWDAIASINDPSQGVAVGESWTSKLSVPTPMVMRKARSVTYRLDVVRPSEKGRLAVIKSSYQLADSAPNNWPIPYSGKFQVAGAFGFYGNYRVLDLQGDGEELFNIDAGRIEQYEQEYELRLKASLLIPLAGVDPRITINQKLTMTLLGE